MIRFWLAGLELSFRAAISSAERCERQIPHSKSRAASEQQTADGTKTRAQAKREMEITKRNEPSVRFAYQADYSLPYRAPGGEKNRRRRARNAPPRNLTVKNPSALDWGRIFLGQGCPLAGLKISAPSGALRRHIDIRRASGAPIRAE